MAQRLPVVVVPEHYELSFTPDLESERFVGDARIHVRAAAPTSEITLHAVDLAITSASITRGGKTSPARVTADPVAETVTLRSAVPLPEGPAELRLAFRGLLNRDLRGFYISESGGRKYAVTQFQATDARRMFPAFDEPGYDFLQIGDRHRP